MKKILKKLPLILLMVWPHCSRFFEGLIAWLSGNRIDEGIVWICGIVIVGLVNIIYAFFYPMEEEKDDLPLWVLITKLVHIPYYLTNAASGLLLLPAFLFSILVTIGWAAYLVLFIICGFYMIASSLYTVRVIRHLKKEGRITKTEAVLLTVFSFVFVGDIICAIIVYTRSQSSAQIKSEKMQKNS